MNENLEYKFIKPDKTISDFVDCIWLLHNKSESDKEVVIVPDGRIDLFFSQSETVSFRIALFGLETKPEYTRILAQTLIFAISFKPLGVEYILKESITNLENNAKLLNTNFWGFSSDDLINFKNFNEKITEKIHQILPKKIDERKQKLFDLIYGSNGSYTVKELSEKVFWSSRQINRYFNKQYGVSLKSYCNIIRFRTSFKEIDNGKLFSNEAFADQSHFIKETKKLSGVSPKEISKNRNDRFIQFSKF
jgi:AraC-like DNA-binding protein